ncbi:cell surface protein, partial [Clostridioides difficile]|nr:cell surface protein [Clostridioides difficile]
INNIKNETLVNEGSIQGIDVYDENGCKIENEDSGEIWLITILKNSKDVYILNRGEITKISNNSSSVTIKNSGNINTISGS